MSNVQNGRPSNYVFSIVMLAFLFFIFGLVSWVNSILVPYFKVACSLTNHVQSYLSNFAFYIAYLLMTIPASVFLNKVGFKRGVMYGLFILGTGALIFVPAALTREYNLFLVALFTMGTAMAILQTAGNPFVTVIGPFESATQRMTIMGAANQVGGILSPLIFAALVIRESDRITMDLVSSGALVGDAKERALDELIRGVIPPYIGLAVIVIAFGIFFYRSHVPDVDINEINKKDASAESGESRRSVFSYPYLVLGALAIFVHVGTKAITIDTIISYAQSQGLSLIEAKFFPSAVLSSILVGSLTGIALIPKYISQEKALLWCPIAGLIISFGVVFLDVPVTIFGRAANLSIWCMVLMGFFNSVIYTAIWPQAIRNLGKFTNLGSSLLVMGICGNAALPLIYAAVVDHTADLQHSYWVVIPCFLYLIFYAAWGRKIEHWLPRKKRG